jgi:hypothetical protein
MMRLQVFDLRAAGWPRGTLQLRQTEALVRGGGCGTSATIGWRLTVDQPSVSTTNAGEDAAISSGRTAAFSNVMA